MVETRRLSAGKASSGNSDEKIVPPIILELQLIPVMIFLNMGGSTNLNRREDSLLA